MLQFLLQSGVDLIRCKAHINLYAKLLFECFLPRLGREPAHDLFFYARNNVSESIVSFMETIEFVMIKNICNSLPISGELMISALR